MDREAFTDIWYYRAVTEMLEIIDVIRQVAPTDITVLISGEVVQVKKLLQKLFMGK